MAQEIVRCPFCVQDSEFRPMLRRSKKSYVCVGCGHLSSLSYPYLRCTCPGCRRMNRIANRISREHADVAQPANS